MLGPVLGPACGGWMSERASWRWTCWVPVRSQFPPPVLGLTGMTNKAMAAVGLELVSTFAFYESYIPSILTAKVKRLRKEQSNPDLYTVMDIDAAGGGKSGTLAVIESASRPGLPLWSLGHVLSTDSAASHVSRPRPGAGLVIAVLRRCLWDIVPDCCHREQAVPLIAIQALTI